MGLVALQQVESPRPEIKPMSLALASGFLITGPPRSSKPMLLTTKLQPLKCSSGLCTHYNPGSSTWAQALKIGWYMGHSPWGLSVLSQATGVDHSPCWDPGFHVCGHVRPAGTGGVGWVESFKELWREKQTEWLGYQMIFMIISYARLRTKDQETKGIWHPRHDL